jgi:hypothetical protein
MGDMKPTDLMQPVLRIWVRDPVPVLTPGYRIRDPGSNLRELKPIFELQILDCFMQIRILDPESFWSVMEEFGSGINIPVSLQLVLLVGRDKLPHGRVLWASPLPQCKPTSLMKFRQTV